MNSKEVEKKKNTKHAVQTIHVIDIIRRQTYILALLQHDIP